MFRLTVGEFLDREDYSDIKGAFCIYIIRDVDTILYIGKSQDIISRLWQHIGPEYTGAFGRGPSDIGRFIVANLPISRCWIIDMLTLEDCIHYTIFEIRAQNTDIAETTLIKLLSPCLNRMSNHSMQSDRLSKYNLPWNTAKWPTDLFEEVK